VAHRHVQRALALTVGWLLIGLGVVGLFLPVLQGVLFILMGLYVLSRESHTARTILHRLRDRHPKAYASMQRAKARVLAAWSRWRGSSRRDGADGGGKGSSSTAAP
jgi:uncharacterized membrane protein YbaN (DUF454 family)